jgi:hypothetical protein
MKKTKRQILVVILVVAFGNLSAQRSEVGFGIGTFNYTGDLARNYNFLNSKPAGTIFYRSNMSKVVSFRVAITAGKIGANDAKRPIDPFSSQRAASFNLFLMEVSSVFEYHFLNWREERRLIRFTPYLFAGLGLFGISGVPSKNAEYSNMQVSIPFGVGAKYIINPKWYVSLEFGPRKTFFDYLDNVSIGDQQTKDYQYGNRFNNDAYYYLGLSVTHSFYDIPCPTNPYK